MLQEKRSLLHLIIVIGTLAYILSGCAAAHKSRRYEMEARAVTHPSLESVQKPEVEKPMSRAELERLADLSFARGNLASALVQYDKALAMDSNNTRLHSKKGRLFLAGELYQDAIQEFGAVIKIEPENTSAYEQTGQAFFSMKQYDQAQKYFLRALELDPNLWQAHNSLGMISDYRGDYDRARHHYLQGIRIRPDMGLFYNNLGVSLSLAAQYDEAVNVLRKAIANKCSEPKVYNNLGIVLCKIGKYGEALEAFAEIGGESRAYNNLGCVLLKTGELEKAISCFRKAISLDHKFYQKASSNLKAANIARLRNVDKPWEYDSGTKDTQVEDPYNKRRPVIKSMPAEVFQRNVTETGFLVEASDSSKWKMSFEEIKSGESFRSKDSGAQDANPSKESEKITQTSDGNMGRTHKFVINFGRNSKDLAKECFQVLEEITMLAEKYMDNSGITITGYTDSRGGYEHNLELSKQRANFVKSYLIGKGIEPSKITINGKGPNNSVASNDTPEGRRLNRRVEIQISVKEKAVAIL